LNVHNELLSCNIFKISAYVVEYFFLSASLLNPS
jgi:hypothetical protein